MREVVLIVGTFLFIVFLVVIVLAFVAHFYEMHHRKWEDR